MHAVPDVNLSASPQLIGVIDLMGGVAVRAVAGKRSEYRPVVSRLCDSADPLAIAAAYRDRYGIEELYIADLDSLLGRQPHWSTLAALASEDFHITADLGLRSVADLEPLVALGITRCVAALESLPSPDVLGSILTRLGPGRAVFSLDLADGLPLADPGAWGESSWTDSSALKIANQVIALGVEHLIVLDLRAVGTATGPTTTSLCAEIKRVAPNVTLWTGGGIRSTQDIETLHAAGATGILIASALHDGMLETH